MTPALGLKKSVDSASAPPPQMSLKKLVVPGALLLLVLLCYSNSFNCDWVGDNRAIIQQAPQMRATTWEDGQSVGIKRIFTQDYWWPWLHSGLYRPVATLSYWANWQWSCRAERPASNEPCEASVAGFHLVNLLLHWANACLVYLLAISIIGKPWTAAFSAGLFATHPIATEAVTNIVGRADLLAALGVLGGLLMYIRGSDCAGGRKAAWLAGLMLITTVGIFSKENGVVVAGLVVCYDLIYRWLPLPDRKQRGREFKRCLVSYLVFVPPLLLYVIAQMGLCQSREPTGPGGVFAQSP